MKKVIEENTSARDDKVLAPPQRRHKSSYSGVNYPLDKPKASIALTTNTSSLSLKHFQLQIHQHIPTPKMGLPQQTNTPIEKPSTSETAENNMDSIPAANVSTQDSSIGATNSSELAGGAIGGTSGDAERAAEKLYEERMEVSNHDDAR